MRSFRYILLIGIFGLLCFDLQAQENWGEGEVEDAVVVVEKERKITLPFASRRFEKVPPLQPQEQNLSAATTG